MFAGLYVSPGKRHTLEVVPPRTPLFADYNGALRHLAFVLWKSVVSVNRLRLRRVPLIAEVAVPRTAVQLSFAVPTYRQFLPIQQRLIPDEELMVAMRTEERMLRDMEADAGLQRPVSMGTMADTRVSFFPPELGPLHGWSNCDFDRQEERRKMKERARQDRKRRRR